MYHHPAAAYYAHADASMAAVNAELPSLVYFLAKLYLTVRGCAAVL